MAEASVERDLSHPPDAVWALVGDFGGIGEWLPGIEEIRIEGDDRVLGMLGMEVRERLVARDDAGRSITYTIADGVPIDSHRATITVVPAGAGSKVTWVNDVEPAEMLPIFTDTYGKGLEALEQHLG